MSEGAARTNESFAVALKSLGRILIEEKCVSRFSLVVKWSELLPPGGLPITSSSEDALFTTPLSLYTLLTSHQSSNRKWVPFVYTDVKVICLKLLAVREKK